MTPRTGRHSASASSATTRTAAGECWSVGEALLASSGQDGRAPERSSRPGSSRPPHREIILSPTWRDAGIGALYAPDAPNEFGGAETIVVTADFGLREGKTIAPSR